MSKVLYTSVLKFSAKEGVSFDNEEMRLTITEPAWMEETNQDGLFYILEEGHYRDGIFQATDTETIHSAQNAEEAITERAQWFLGNGMTTQEEVNQFIADMHAFVRGGRR